MNAFRAYDRIEDSRWVEQAITEEKDQWIDIRAKELIAMFPKYAIQMSGLFLPKEAQLALVGEKAEEAYNDYITRLCYDRAEEEWDRQAPCPF